MRKLLIAASLLTGCAADAPVPDHRHPALDELKIEMARMVALTAELERRVAERPAVTLHVTPEYMAVEADGRVLVVPVPVEDAREGGGAVGEGVAAD